MDVIISNSTATSTSITDTENAWLKEVTEWEDLEKALVLSQQFNYAPHIIEEELEVQVCPMIFSIFKKFRRSLK